MGVISVQTSWEVVQSSYNGYLVSAESTWEVAQSSRSACLFPLTVALKWLRIATMGVFSAQSSLEVAQSS